MDAKEEEEEEVAELGLQRSFISLLLNLLFLVRVLQFFIVKLKLFVLPSGWDISFHLTTLALNVYVQL
jgi:hypothetical protein